MQVFWTNHRAKCPGFRIQASTVGGSSVGPGKNVTTEEAGFFLFVCVCVCFFAMSGNPR